MGTEELDFRTALAALYLPGADRPFEPVRRLWPRVEHVLRASNGDSGALDSAGFTQEAMLLSTPKLVAWAGAQVAAGRCLTSCEERYPSRWLNALGYSAPPAFWMAGDVPPGPYLSVVGSRRPPREDLEFARDVGRAAVALGYSIVSGGAVGCDSASVAAVGARAIEVLPRGLSGDDRHVGRCRLSALAPDEPFSSAGAMERNALIYAASDFTVVVHARYGVGGTWTGARAALRRGLGRLIVQVRPNDPASRALIALGGVPLSRPEDLAEALKSEPRQRGLGL